VGKGETGLNLANGFFSYNPLPDLTEQGQAVAAVAKSVLPIRFPQAEPEQAAVVAKSIPHSSASNLTETAYCWIAGSQCRQQQD